MTNSNPTNPYEPFTINGPLVGTVVLSVPLTANGVNQVTPLSWNFSEFQMASTNFPNFYNPAPPPFSFTTVNGKITAWSVSASWTNGDGWNLSTVAITSTTEGDVVDEVGGNDEEIIGTSTAPGTWTCVQPVAQPYTAPPAPPPVDPLQAQVTALQAQVAALQAQVAADDAWKAEWIPYYQWQASGWQARAATLTQQLTNANNEIADLQAELKKK